MAEATDLQINGIAGEVRQQCETLRDVVASMNDLNSRFDDVYAALTGSQSEWVETRPDSPPHVLEASDMLAIHTFRYHMTRMLNSSVDHSDAEKIQAFNDIRAQWPIVLEACIETL